MNRTKHLRKLIKEAGGFDHAIYCSGPNATFGTDGQVSYTACYTNLNDHQKHLICERMMAERDDVHKAYITKRCKRTWGWGGSTGGNIKVVYKSRANGRAA